MHLGVYAEVVSRKFHIWPIKTQSSCVFLFLRKAAWVMRKNIVPGGIRRHEFGLGSVPAIPYLTFFQIILISESQSYL